MNANALFWHAWVRSDCFSLLQPVALKSPDALLDESSTEPTYRYTLLHVACAVGATQCAQLLIKTAIARKREESETNIALVCMRTVSTVAHAHSFVLVLISLMSVSICLVVRCSAPLL
jgi:hypothetical protein